MGCFERQHKDQLDIMFADMVYECGLPFTFAAAPSTVRFCKALSEYQLLEGVYKPPSPWKLANSLLDAAVAGLEAAEAQMRTAWRVSGVSFECDGWTDCFNRKLTLLMAGTAQTGSLVIHSQAESLKRMTGEWIAGFLRRGLEVIPQGTGSSLQRSIPSSGQARHEAAIALSWTTRRTTAGQRASWRPKESLQGRILAELCSPRSGPHARGHWETSLRSSGVLKEGQRSWCAL